ncbi:GntR family uxuAB operon transcriptional repressor [Neisseria perflava]|uniref:FCD domain-containing protein n=1 Tax=Neisseria perflava TaxID=33053 RepID=UPI00209D860D|nr:FCD domain-containing protein [Neisseria perflava]MCP1771574.1 GntR family uxuAB operon transcriptional repressor [Neisseria perflava]
MNATKTNRSYKIIGECLKKELSEGKYKVGERLPPEREIAEQYKVSRTVIREALIMLELEKLVEVRKGSGVYVLDFPRENADKDKPKVNVDYDIGPFELLQARQMVESGIAEFAAIQATRNDVIKLKKLLEKERETLDKGQDDYEEDRAFHYCLAEITQNDVLMHIQKELWDYRNYNPMWERLHEYIGNFEYRKNWLGDHEAILTAIQRKDPAMARKAMWQHLENVKQTIFELSDLEDPNFDGYLFNASPLSVGV